MKYIAAAFCFMIWIVATIGAILSFFGILILAMWDKDLTKWWFDKIPQSILETFKK